jgi:hypothetical protein
LTVVPEDIRSILATDCGSTTTKAVLIERGPDGYRLVTRGEAPTTVEAPFEDVTRGVLNAVKEVEELRGRRLLDGDRILSPQQGEDGVDLYLSTSSAGGGLQMMVSGPGAADDGAKAPSVRGTRRRRDRDGRDRAQRRAPAAREDPPHAASCAPT